MNKQAILKRMIYLCWILLTLCFAIKLLGGNWFEIVVKNEKFITVCNFIDKHLLLLKLLQYSTLIITSFLYFGCLFEIKKVDIPLIFLINIFMIVIRYFYSNIGLIAHALYLIIYPIMRSKKFFRPIIYFCILNIFQIVSLFIKCEEIKILSSNTLIGLIMMIDYYIMLVLLFLYNKIIRRNENG